MIPIRTILVDDEEPARDRLRGLLDEFGDVEIVAEARDGDRAVEAISGTAPDLVFLDIEMPGLVIHAILVAILENAVVSAAGSFPGRNVVDHNFPGRGMMQSQGDGTLHLFDEVIVDEEFPPVSDINRGSLGSGGYQEQKENQ